jgi:CheY-like chemotaxis protein
LIAGDADKSFAHGQDSRYVLITAATGAQAVWRAQEEKPDVILLQDDLPDMPSTAACRLLRTVPHVGHAVPILIFSAKPATPEQRVIALRAGVWDYLHYPLEPEEFSLRIESYLQAKGRLDAAVGESLVDPATGLLSRPGLVRRARELGALLNRKHGGLACVVFDLQVPLTAIEPGRLLGHVTRQSDGVGAFGDTELGVVAPLTDRLGVLQLAKRVESAIDRELSVRGLLAIGADFGIQIGYEIAGNLRYSPQDPAAVLAGAHTAVREGIPEPEYPRLRRSEPDRSASHEPVALEIPVGVWTEERRRSL